MEVIGIMKIYWKKKCILKKKEKKILGIKKILLQKKRHNHWHFSPAHVNADKKFSEHKNSLNHFQR